MAVYMDNVNRRCAGMPHVAAPATMAALIYCRPMPYVIEDQRVISKILELNVVDHCNMRCRGCSHLSPVSPASSVSPAQALEQLTKLARCYRAHTLRLLGGEPLLHPNLCDLIRAARRTGIAQRIQVVTNGLLLDRTADELWQETDAIEVSLYPGREPTGATWRQWEERAAHFGVQLEGTRFPRFRESYLEQANEDPALVERVYRTCLIAGPWGCHNVANGFFFKCPQAHVLPARLPGLGAAADSGVSLDQADLFLALVRYLGDPAPIPACRHCLGAVGRLFDHVELRRPSWRAAQAGDAREKIDFAFLEHLERVDPNADNGCAESVVR
jgi:hypothetical protein